MHISRFNIKKSSSNLGKYSIYFRGKKDNVEKILINQVIKENEHYIKLGESPEKYGDLFDLIDRNFILRNYERCCKPIGYSGVYYPNYSLGIFCKDFEQTNVSIGQTFILNNEEVFLVLSKNAAIIYKSDIKILELDLKKSIIFAENIFINEKYKYFFEIGGKRFETNNFYGKYFQNYFQNYKIII